jgi:DNA transformation protein
MNAQTIIRKLETELAPLGAFRARPMFGGHGLYLDDLMFGLIYDARLYLKADEESRPAFEREGSEPFVYDSSKGCITMSYWLCPPAALKDPAKLRAWVGRAHAAAQRVKMKRKPRRKRAKF